MAKLDTLPGQSRTTRATSPIQTKGRTTTHEGGAAYSRDDKSELFILAVNFLFGEPTFYESADARADRYRTLVHSVTKSDPDWMQRFIPWLRNSENIRTASIVAAVEYKAAGGPGPRGVINSAIARADEPAEAIAYAKARGIPVAGGLQRGIADAAARVYNEYTAMKYDGATRNYRMGDVLNLVHPSAKGQWQNDLFKFLLDKRHHNDATPTFNLGKLKLRAELDEIPVSKRKAFVRTSEGQQKLQDAGITWESLSGWLQGPMDAAAWEAVIPTMGYMALLRNLRNFDEAGVSEKVKQTVAAKLSDPEQVAKSRQFPFRFMSAYNEVSNLIWQYPLEQALNASIQNIPVFKGETDILVDTSGSMQGRTSGNSKMDYVTTGAIFGVAMALRNPEAKLYGFASGTPFSHKVPKGASVLPEVKKFTNRIGEAGHGTEIAQAVRDTYKAGQTKRVVIISDMQTFDDRLGGYGYRSNWNLPRYYNQGWTAQQSRQDAAYGKTVSELVPSDVPMYGFNLAGYGSTVVDSGKSNRHEFGGMTDATFKLLSLIEQGKSADWPF